MNSFKIHQIDYRYLLVDTYKALGLNEKELALLLVVDNILKEEPTLITAEILALKMNLDVNEIDDLLVSLMNRGFLEYKEFGDTSNLVTSIGPTYSRLQENFAREVITNATLSENKQKQVEVSNIFQKMEKELGRPLSPTELDRVKDWIDRGYSEQTIIDSVHECQNKSRRVSINAIDRVILKRMTSQDVRKEGYSAISEKYYQDIDSAIDIADTKWADD